jgi:hypothetical protein
MAGIVHLSILYQFAGTPVLHAMWQEFKTYKYEYEMMPYLIEGEQYFDEFGQLGVLTRLNDDGWHGLMTFADGGTGEGWLGRLTAATPEPNNPSAERA